MLLSPTRSLTRSTLVQCSEGNIVTVYTETGNYTFIISNNHFKLYSVMFILNSQYLLILEHQYLKSMTTNAEGVGNIVAQHYDNLPEKGREQRKDSRIFFMRCFNNWIKSTLIHEYIEKIRDRNPDGHRVKVLDFGKNILNNKTKSREL